MSTLLLDMESKRILAVTLKRPMTIRQLAELLGIPIAICSKKVHMLRLRGFLERKVVLDKNNRELIYYKGIMIEEKIPIRIEQPGNKLVVGFDSGMR